MQQAVGLHPFVVLVALLVGGSLLGLPGLIVAVPLAAALQVIVRRAFLANVEAHTPTAVEQGTAPGEANAAPAEGPAVEEALPRPPSAAGADPPAARQYE